MTDEELAERASARVGTFLNEKWRLDALLGVGGMASVYAATHRNQKRAAVKILHPGFAADDTIRQRFLREGYAANSVGHPGVVCVDDDDVLEDGGAFLVMELLSGETLQARWERKGPKLDVGDVLAYADELLDVLAAAHDKSIVHRDIKPDNLFVTRAGVLKVLDFGIASIANAAESNSRSTRAGSVMGTPGFMAPEQARGRWELVDAQSDLWATGATLFTLLTGELVHGGGTGNEQLARAITEKAPPIASVRADLPETVAALVDRALAYDKAERWPDARSMQSAVREAYEVVRGGTPSRVPVPTIPERRAPEPEPELAPDNAAPRALPTTTALSSERTPTLRPSTARLGVALSVAALACASVLAAFAIRRASAPANHADQALEMGATQPSAQLPAPSASDTGPVVEPAGVEPAPSAVAPSPSSAVSAGKPSRRATPSGPPAASPKGLNPFDRRK